MDSIEDPEVYFFFDSNNPQYALNVTLRERKTSEDRNKTLV
jgi:hypothetical protein